MVGIVEALCYHLRDHRVTLRLNEEVDAVEQSRTVRLSRRSRAGRRSRVTPCCTRWAGWATSTS